MIPVKIIKENNNIAPNPISILHKTIFKTCLKLLLRKIITVVSIIESMNECLIHYGYIIMNLQSPTIQKLNEIQLRIFTMMAIKDQEKTVATFVAFEIGHLKNREHLGVRPHCSNSRQNRLDSYRPYVSHTETQ